MSLSSAWYRLLRNTEAKRMTEQERDASRPEADRAESGGESSGSSPSPADEDAVPPTDRATINQERALESGEENAV